MFVGRTSDCLLSAVASRFFVDLCAHANTARCDHQRAAERVSFLCVVTVAARIGRGCVFASRVAPGRRTDYPCVFVSARKKIKKYLVYFDGGVFREKNFFEKFFCFGLGISPTKSIFYFGVRSQ